MTARSRRSNVPEATRRAAELSKLGQAALAYAAAGWPVFPLAPGKKRPICKGGFRSATAQRGAIKKWWTETPEANVGLALPSGFVAVDVDGPEGMSALRALNLALPATAKQCTPHGWHFVYRLPDGAVVRQSVSEIARGVDTRVGGKGYLVVEPSHLSDGDEYRWESPLSEGIAPAPAWLLQDRAGQAAAATALPSKGVPILEGKRNSTLISLAGSMRRRGMSPEAVESALVTENAHRCLPPLRDEEVRRIAASSSRFEPGDSEGGEPGGSRGPTQKDRLVELAADVELFSTPEQEPFAHFKVNGHHETWPLREGGFKSWLAYRFWEREGKAPGAQAVQDALDVLKGRALYEGLRRPVYVRLAGDAERVLLDLGREDWAAVEVTESGWRVVEQPDVKFRRPGGLLPLPVPVRRGSLNALRRFVNVETDADFILLVAWLVGTMHPRGPHPILALMGEQGSAKSTTARMLRAIVDPNTSSLRSAPRNEHDLAIAARNAWVLTFDNFSRVPAWLSDALCRISTGGGLATRKLYTDAEEVLFDATRPLSVNGIGEMVTRGDLLDRSLLVTLPPIADRKRKPVHELWAEFEKARPHLLGGLLDAAVCGLRELHGIRLPELPRMADFAKWVAACSPALPFAAEKFLGAYKANQQGALEQSLGGDPVGEALFRLGQYKGTAGGLLPLLANQLPGSCLPSRWPSSPMGLASWLRRIAPSIRAAGGTIDFKRKPGGRRDRLIVFRAQPGTKNG